MALVCCINPSRLCDGCMDCMEPEVDAQDDYNRRVDAAYDRKMGEE